MQTLLPQQLVGREVLRLVLPMRLDCRQLLVEQEEQPQVLLLHLVLLLPALLELAAAVALTSLESQVRPELMVASLAAAAAVGLPPTTASPLALAVLAAAARSTSSLTVNP